MTPPKPITALYRDFEAAHSAVQEAPDAKVDVSIEKCRKIAAEIVKLPAQNIDEMILKSASHCVAPVPSEAWKPWQASTRGRPECPANTGRTTSRSNSTVCVRCVTIFLRLAAGSGAVLRAAPEPIATDCH